MSVRFLDGGESCLVAELGDAIDIALNRRVRALGLALEQAGVKGVVEAVPTYRSLAIYYNPLVISRDALRQWIDRLYDSVEGLVEQPPRLMEIPTIYGGAYGPDLEFVACRNGLSPDEVVRLHAGQTYHVYMLGFMAGFPYLGDLPARLAVPRLSTPRLKVPAGSVGIGGSQTGIYPIESPGGWRIIGRTPLRLFDPSAETPTLLLPGDRVRFVPITQWPCAGVKPGRL